jgi:hypothetical protein
MSTLKNKIKEARATKIKMTEEELIAFLDAGRTIAEPLRCYPRLLYGSIEERNKCCFITKSITSRS